MCWARHESTRVSEYSRNEVAQILCNVRLCERVKNIVVRDRYGFGKIEKSMLYVSRTDHRWENQVLEWKSQLGKCSVRHRLVMWSDICESLLGRTQQAKTGRFGNGVLCPAVDNV